MTADSVVITGMGCVSALGNNCADMAKALFAGHCGIGALRLPRALERMRVKLAAQVRDFSPDPAIDRKRLSFLDPFSLYALTAAIEAVRQSGLEEKDLAGPRTAVVLGTGIGGVAAMDESFLSFYGENSNRSDPRTIPRVMANASASQISMYFGATGPAFVVCTACASSNHAAGLALGLIRSGAADRVITGGSEACITPGVMASWEALHVLAKEPCRPFSKGRTGMNLGEGGGAFVLERADAAKARGARPLARLAGYGMTSDAGDILRPDPKGAAAAMTAALNDAGLPPQAIGYINAHGTGTVTNDIAETAAVRSAFGAHADRLCMSSTKSMHGHALGGAGALELAATVLALCEGIMPPTINWKAADPKCDIDCVPNEARRADFGAAITNSFAFGGLNAVLCVTRSDFSH